MVIKLALARARARVSGRACSISPGLSCSLPRRVSPTFPCSSLLKAAVWILRR